MLKSIIWKLMERFGVQGVQFVLQIILARILAPEDYGALSLMIIFTTLANVFIQNGFNTSLIQNKDVTEDDYSSVFWLTLGIAVLLYGVFFFTAPLIAEFYMMPEMILPFRVISLMLIPGALNSVQTAKVSREMDFKKIFYSNITAIVISGVTGVVIAKNGGGIWALVAQNLLTVTVASLVMLFTVRWRPKLVFNIKRIKVLFVFGWKLLVSATIDTLYQDLSSMVIGKKYNADMLAFHNRGKQFPQFMINAVNGAVQSVLLPALSEKQDNKEKVRELMRNSLVISSYIIFPMMAGLAAVAEPMVSLILTDKWLPCVPYLQIFCFSFAFWPIHTCNLQAVNAMGRSDIFLRLEIIKKSYGIIILMIAVFCFDSPLAIAMTSAVTAVISSYVNSFCNKKLIGYSYFQQMRDILPSFILSGIMCAIVYWIGTYNMTNLTKIIVQISTGMFFYITASYLTKNAAMMKIIQVIKHKSEHFR